MLGPDLFGLRVPPAPEAFLTQIDQTRIDEAQVQGFLRWLNLTADAPRSRRLEELPRDVDAVWEHGLPEKRVRLPKVFHAIWLGGPLSGPSPATRLFRDNLARLAAQFADAGVMVALWTDVSRAALRQPDAEVADMVAWANAANVTLVSVDEVFHDGAPMRLDRFYRSEMAKLVPAGFAEAADILRLEILLRFGGLYSDPDNRVTDVAGLLRLAQRVDLAIGYESGMLNTGMLLAVRGHRFVSGYLDHIEGNYDVPQPELLPDTVGTTRAENASWLQIPDQTVRRTSVMGRTGPDNLSRVLAKTGYEGANAPALITQFVDGRAHSWVPPVSLDPPRRYTEADVPAVLVRVVATLIRGLFNRDGDLHLTAVAPVINGLPDPAAAWIAVIRFILARPDLAARVKTVTDRIQGVPPSSDVVVDVPAAVRSDLGLTDPSPGQDPFGVWHRGELMRRAKLTCPAPAGRAAAGGAGGSLVAALVDPSTSVAARGVGWSRLRVLDGGPEGVPSDAVRAAVDAVTADGAPVDCVVGVGRVLMALGGSPASWDDSVLTSRSWTVARWLGGHFDDGSLDGLLDLAPRHVTAVRLQPPGEETHMVLVEKLDDDRYLMIDPKKRGRSRFTAFDPATPAATLPPQLRAPVRLVRQLDGRLAQLAVPAGGAPRTIAAPSGDTTGVGADPVVPQPESEAVVLPPANLGPSDTSAVGTSIAGGRLGTRADSPSPHAGASGAVEGESSRAMDETGGESVATTGGHRGSRLLADLRASEQAEQRAYPANDPLGPDPFGIRVSPPPPSFLAGIDFDRIETNRLLDLFDKLNLVRPAPEDGDLSPDLLRPDDTTVWTRTDDDIRQGSWPTKKQRLPEELRSLPEPTQMPKAFFSVWLGTPLTAGRPTTDELRVTVAESARTARQEGMRWVVLTDLPRSAFEAARTDRNAAPAGVAEMRDWAVRNYVILLNVDEIFHVGAPMVLDRFYRTEVAKLAGPGYGAASDILRVEFLNRFGGIYLDGHDRVRTVSGLETLFKAHGYAVFADEMGGELTAYNSALLAGRGHPFIRAYLRQIERNYGKSQAELLRHVTAEPTREANWKRFGGVFGDLRRNSVLARTGPDALAAVITEIGFIAGDGRTFDIPQLTQFVSEGGLSWEPGSSGTGEPRPFGPDEVLGVVKRITATLIRDLYNRDGDLHLTLVAPVVNRLPDPDAVWWAVISYLRGHPVFGPLVKTVTDRAMSRRSQRDDIVVRLPPEVTDMFGLRGGDAGSGPPGEWRRGELARPVDVPHWLGSPGLTGSTSARRRHGSDVRGTGQG